MQIRRNKVKVYNLIDETAFELRQRNNKHQTSIN